MKRREQTVPHLPGLAEMEWHKAQVHLWIRVKHRGDAGAALSQLY
jgi:hypothetical protein